jgi:hypothetical protein
MANTLGQLRVSVTSMAYSLPSSPWNGQAVLLPSVTSMAYSLPSSPWNGQAVLLLLKILTLLGVHSQAFTKFYIGDFFKTSQENPTLLTIGQKYQDFYTQI